MYLKELIEEYWKENLFTHEGTKCYLGWYNTEINNKEITFPCWFNENKIPIKDNSDKFGYKRVIFFTDLLDDGWNLVKK